MKLLTSRISIAEETIGAWVLEGVADVVKLDAVDIVAGCDFGEEVEQILANFWIGRV